jgi:peptide/nickel transport system substrate-binding protein
MKSALKRIMVSLFAMGILLIVGCSSNNGNQENVEAPANNAEFKVLNVASGTYAVDASLDPLDGSWNYCYVCYEGLAETLFKIGDDWSAQPWLASEATAINDEHTVWEVTLRDDVTYHNGNKMTAETVKECLQRAMDVSDQAKGILNIVDIKADGQRLTLTLGGPCYDLQHELCNSVFVIYDKPTDGDYLNGISYTGPYMLDKYVEGVSKTFVPYEGYWDGIAKIDQVNYAVYADTAASLIALQSGEVDFVMGVPFEDLERYESSSDFKVSYADPNSDEMIYFNENRPATSDTTVKQAIALALDRETICDGVYYGHAEPLYTIFSDAFYFGGTDGLDLMVSGYDPEKAAALLADGGWADTDGDRILDKDGVALDLTVVAYPDQYIMNAADVLTNELAKLGIKLTINATYDYPSFEASGDFDMIWTYEGFTRSGTPLYFLSTFLSTNGSGNHGGFSNTAVDEACEGLLATTDKNKIRELVQQAEQAVADDGHMITWAVRDIPFVYSSRVDLTPQAYRDYMIDQTTDIEM